MTIAHAVPHYTKYGTNGYDCFAVGLPTFFAKTMRVAKEWAKEHGLEIVRV